MMLVAAAAMMFASCNKEDNTPAGNGNPTDTLSQTEKMIVGSWNETESLYIFTQGGTCDTTSMFEEGEFIQITFNADKTYSSIYHSEDGDSEDGRGTWSASGNTLTMADEFGPMDYNIDRLDADVFNITYSEEGEDEDGPYTLNIIIRMAR